MSSSFTVSRRDLLKAGAAAGGLLIGITLPATARVPARAPGTVGPFAPNAFLQITPDGVVTIWVSKSEMGQGVRTSLPMILAEELDADWSQVHVVQADAEDKFGNMGTGGSMSVQTMWEPLRRAGAQAREMLVAAAAAGWGVAVESCRTAEGVVIHEPSGRRVAYGELAEKAAAVPVPEQPRLKDQKDFRLLGTSMPQLDTPSRVDGTARYGMDVRVPGMVYASIARCPVFGGTLRGYDTAKAQAVPGVKSVVEIPNAVAVIAENSWAAMEGRRALECHWDEGAAADFDSPTLSRRMRDRAVMGGALARNDGDALTAVAKSRRALDVVYEVPFLAHAPMEPINCVVDARADRCEVWAPHQAPDWARREVADALKLKPEQVQVHVTLLGGGFGRRFLPEDVVEAAHVSRAAGAPAKVVWTREDDLQHDWYRPASVHRMLGAVDRNGRALAWLHRIVAPSINEQRWPGSVKNGLDEDACEGATGLPYAIPNLRVEYCLHQTPVPVSWWRSVYPSQNAFANECFLDELAHLAGQDPLAFRRTLLAKEPRYLAVLNLAAEQAGWGKAPPGHGLGLAIHKFWTETIVAEVAEVSVEEGRVRVHRVTCAVDCGFALNPDGVKAQIEGGVVYGLSAALHGAITIERGRVKQSNFHDYPVLRMNEMPEIAVHLVPSGDKPFGVGEPGTPPIAPAVANAVFAATGKRVRELPIRL